MTDFNLRQLGYMRVAAIVPQIKIADVDFNVAAILASLDRIAADRVRIALFPELCITGYTCADLFHHATLLDAAADAIDRLCQATKDLPTMIVVGAPLRHNGAIYNCAVAIAAGRVVAIVPKTYLPNYNEFYEKRWFASGADIPASQAWSSRYDAPLTTDLIIDVDDAHVAIEICEDLWTPISPSTHAALQGADVILNLSASDDQIGKYAYLRSLLAQQSARCICAYIYASAGFGESSTDLVFDGKGLIYENGNLLAEAPRWTRRPSETIADIDLHAIARDRVHNTSFADTAARNPSLTPWTHVAANLPTTTPTLPLRRDINPHPFVPDNGALIDARCEEIINIQVSGLAQRLHATNTRHIVVGISGGLDSTLALLVAVRTFDTLNLPRTGITGVTMPGFGTTGRTYRNSIDLMKSLGVTIREISIVPAVNQHFADIDHDPANHDVTYENSQARERTQLLMDIANQVGGMVLGTGDLSELALGWATYNGDHMSMYGVNTGIPKTLVKHLVSWCAHTTHDACTRDTLLDIISTPISPELIPADPDGNIAQKTEDLVGPYELHDFFLYHTLRYGATPRRIYFLALQAFARPSSTDADSPSVTSPNPPHATRYTPEVILHWLRTFFRRFFNQQFKRSCLPDGPKVGSVCLSPRGDWRMPSDASSALWLSQLNDL